MKQISKDMIVTEALAVDPDVAGILMNEGLHCIFCGAASGETLAEAGYVHGFSPEEMDQLVAAINAYLESKEEKEA